MLLPQAFDQTVILGRAYMIFLFSILHPETLMFWHCPSTPGNFYLAPPRTQSVVTPNLSIVGTDFGSQYAREPNWVSQVGLPFEDNSLKFRFSKRLRDRLCALNPSFSEVKGF